MNIKRQDLVSCGLNQRSGRPRIVISSDSVDAMNDRILQDGLEITPPIRMLLNHDYHSLPVGLIPDSSSVHRRPHRTEVEFDFFEGDAEIARVANLYRQGGFDASVGFRILQATPNQHGGMDITRSVLHEVSLTATPANRDCVALVRSLVGRSRARRDEEILDLEIVDDEETGLARADVIAAVQVVTRQLAAQELARQRGHVDDESDVDALDTRFDPLGNLADATLLADAMRTAIPSLLRAEIRRLQGKVD